MTRCWSSRSSVALTAFMAATIALTQYDIKRVVAYSTVCQLGYMIFALGSGAWVAGIFHLVTHAFFKALLFLGAGSVIHGMHDEQDMRRMGGLKKYMPITYWTFLVGAPPPMPGSFRSLGSGARTRSSARLLGRRSSAGIAIVGFVAALFTSLYMFRVVFLTFHGQERFDPHDFIRMSRRGR